MKKVKKNTPGARFREIRGNLTQIEMADALGIKQAMISRYEANKEMPSPRILLRIAKFAKRPAEWIMLGDDYASASVHDAYPLGKGNEARDKELLAVASSCLRRTGDPELRELSGMMAAYFESKSMRKKLLDYYDYLKTEPKKKKR